MGEVAKVAMAFAKSLVIILFLDVFVAIEGLVVAVPPPIPADESWEICDPHLLLLFLLVARLVNFGCSLEEFAFPPAEFVVGDLLDLLFFLAIYGDFTEVANTLPALFLLFDDPPAPPSIIMFETDLILLWLMLFYYSLVAFLEIKFTW